MMDKILLFRSMIITLMLLVLAWDGLQWLVHPHSQPAGQHREMLLTGALLWFASVLYSRNNDDDWAGQF